MSDASNGNRSSKRAAKVLDDEESIREQPALKKREEEVCSFPSPEVAELQRQVRKLEKKLKRSSQATEEAESRAELAEKKLAEMTRENDAINAEKAKMRKKMDKNLTRTDTTEISAAIDENDEGVKIRKHTVWSEDGQFDVFNTYVGFEIEEDEVEERCEEREDEEQEEDEEREKEEEEGENEEEGEEGEAQKDGSLALDDLDQQTTPACILCEVYPTIVQGYMAHLRIYHRNATFIQNDRYILCGCGRRVTSARFDPDHSKNCDGRQFSIHWLENQVICEVEGCYTYPKSVLGYMMHMKRRHDTSLEATGIYLKCPCGLKVTSRNNKHHLKYNCDGHKFKVCKIKSGVEKKRRREEDTINE